MNIDSLNIVQDLIAQTENNQVEFKETTGQLERGMETLCAFLNSVGGTVLFGVTDKGKILGQEVSDKTKREIAEAINRLEPLPAVQVAYIALPESDKKVIALHVEEARYERPFLYRGRAYTRVESVTTVMPRQVVYGLMLSHSGFNYSWDACFNDKLKIADLDENEILKTVRLGVESGRLPETIGSDIPTILEKFNLYEEGRLKHAAAVLFARDEMMDYSQCLLRLARFKGIDKTVFMDNQRVSGNIFRLLDAAMAFLFKHLSLSATTDALERTEQLTVPYRALREAVINALCHRTYGNFSESVSIAIYDDRLEIINPGALPMGWDLAKLKSSHDSKPSNPLIASVLYKRRVLENWGRGIRLMLDECIQAGLPEPDFQFDCGDFILTFRYKEALSAAGTTPDKHPTSTRQVPDKYPTSTRQVVEAIGEHKYSVKDLMTAMNLKDRENFLDNYLNPAVEAGLVVPLYPDQPKHPRQKYLLTEKGKQLLS